LGEGVIKLKFEKKVGVYVRVSTKDQDVELQLVELRKYVADRGWAIYKEYVDIGQSGAKDSRPQLNQLMLDAKRRRFNIVAVWKFDRFARSVRHLVNSLYEFKELNIDFISLTEGVDTSTSTGRAMFGIIGVMAELERDLIRERVQAGMRRAKARGKAIGRPKVHLDIDEVKRLREEGHNVTEISRILNVSRANIYRNSNSYLNCSKGV
jgi:DNA invertase Pin-like site-specific DNA recombinase